MKAKKRMGQSSIGRLMKIPFNKPSFMGFELHYVSEAVLSQHTSGGGAFTKKCQELMEKAFGAKKVLLTTSCTDALEMASLLLNLKEGDEVIAPSFTFVSTVNAFMLRGAKPVFSDIRPDTKNLDENLIEEKITKRTKAIYVTHYAGVCCEMEKIGRLAKKHNLFVVEDAAQAVSSKYKDDFAGTIGTFGCFSFHETKNFMCGEGGAILINDDRFTERAEIVWEKGTDRVKFSRMEVGKYTWQDIGSSYLLSDVLAAFLFAQLEKMPQINRMRSKIYERYYDSLISLENDGLLELPRIPDDCTSNHHLFYVLLNSEKERDNLSNFLKTHDICSIFHYVPLHTSPMGKRLGYRKGDLPITERVSKRLLRLPFYNSMTEEEQSFVINKIKDFFSVKK